MQGVVMTAAEKANIEKICHLSEITIKDIVSCAECYKKMIDDKDYHKAKIIKYALYTILARGASIKIISAVKNAIYELNSYEKLFSLERWEAR